MNVTERIHGALLGAAIGDAMGAATELRTPAQILAHFGGEVTTFLPPPDDTFARGQPAGAVTDDFSQAYYLSQAIVAAHGRTDWEVGHEAILAWWADERFRAFAGPTTAKAIARLRGEEIAEPFFLYRGGQATNGAAMRILPVGCVAADATDAIASAIAVSLPTHDNHLAVTAAAIIAVGVQAGIASSLTGTAAFAQIVAACQLAAPLATTASLTATHEVAGASVTDRLHTAVAIAQLSPDVRTAALTIASRVGCGLWANEAVPAAVGIVAAAPDAMSAIIAAVNAGDDADTVATMVGALVGAASGPGAFAPDLTHIVCEVNKMDLASLAHDLAAVRR